MKIALVYWNCAFHCFFLLLFFNDLIKSLYIWCTYLYLKMEVQTSKSIFYVNYWENYWVLQISKWRRPYWWPSWISSCAEKQVSFFFKIMSIVCEKLHHNECRFYIETTYEMKKLYVCPSNVWCYCVDSSIDGHLGFHMLIKIPSLYWYEFISYAS